jgi:SAM-dependent methyltransferase
MGVRRSIRRRGIGGRGNGLIKPDRLRARIIQALDFEFRPDFRFIGSALRRALQNRLAGEDSDSKKAVVVGESLWLAHVLGLKKTRILHLPYPDFTIENLALLSNEYDFVIADRVLHRCQSAEDAARETMRVLRPGGWFVHTASILDIRSMSPVNRLTLAPRGLSTLFPYTVNAAAGSWRTAVSWIAGQKAENAPNITPSVATRVARRSFYRFRPQPAKFGVMTMIRNEAPYLLEWIAHYRALGFGQITIYDNGSNDDSPRMLLALSKAGIINGQFWRDRPRSKQSKAYTHALRRLWPFVEWCLFIDLDEFLVLDPGLSLDDLLPTDPEVSGIGIQWRTYGSAGLRNRETGLTIERFRMARSQNSRILKSLVRVRDVEFMGVHTPKRVRGRMTDIAGRTVDNLQTHALPWIAQGPARINHYYIRSWEEFECKRARGRGAVTGQFRPVGTFDGTGPGEVELLDALRYAPAVKAEVARLRKIVDGG